MSPPGGHPDEPSNLGLPVLSNPLKLCEFLLVDSLAKIISLTFPIRSAALAVAHASDSARDRIEMGGDTGVDPFAHQAGDVQMGDAEDDSQSRGTSTEPDPSRTHLSVGPSRRGYFELGIYSPKLDTESRFDPIARGLLSVTEAAKLFDLFMRRINGPITLLDPVLQ